ncbi:hypothetical protein VKT23_012164 [Stygiomarasmius scandens]|uniref:Uncharacterized protein n=1 Tax=Marasmiellus scandens TaxID=2682957 RepID=A0ABR1JBQ7_9AGAR
MLIKKRSILALFDSSTNAKNCSDSPSSPPQQLETLPVRTPQSSNKPTYYDQFKSSSNLDALVVSSPKAEPTLIDEDPFAVHSSPSLSGQPLHASPKPSTISTHSSFLLPMPSQASRYPNPRTKRLTSYSSFPSLRSLDTMNTNYTNYRLSRVPVSLSLQESSLTPHNSLVISTPRSAQTVIPELSVTEFRDERSFSSPPKRLFHHRKHARGSRVHFDDEFEDDYYGSENRSGNSFDSLDSVTSHSWGEPIGPTKPATFSAPRSLKMRRSMPRLNILSFISSK